MPIVRTHRVRTAPVLPRCSQTRKILPQSRFRKPFRRYISKIDRLYRTIPQSLRASSLYTREPLGVRHPPAFLSTKAPNSICCVNPISTLSYISYLISYILYLSSPLSCRGDFFAPALAARRFDCFIFWDVVEFFHGDSLSSLPAGASPVNVCWRRPSPITKERQ